MMRVTLSLAAFLLSCAVPLALSMGAEDADGGHAGHDHHLAEFDGVRAIHAWSPATDSRKAHVFVEIENGGEAEVMLLGGETGMAESVTLVGFQLRNGEQTYVALPGMPIPAGGEVVLEPRGLALELTGLSGALEEGGSFNLELEFDIGHLDIVVDVERAGATRHSHAGHSH